MSIESASRSLVAEFRSRRTLRTGSLITTVFGDAIAPRGGSVWLGSLIRVMRDFGISERLVRTSVYRLVQDGWLQSTQIGRRSYYSLTDEGAARFAQATHKIYGEPATTWDGRWCLVLLSALDAQNKEAVRKMVAFMAQPAQAKLGSKLLYKTLDRVWRIAGDRSTDYNFYTKRATLGAVYGSTMLAFLDDDTADMQKTRAFLDRRLQDVAKVPKATRPLQAAFSTIGRMLKGAGSMRRKTSGR